MSVPLRVLRPLPAPLLSPSDPPSKARYGYPPHLSVRPCPSFPLRLLLQQLHAEVPPRVAGGGLASPVEPVSAYGLGPRGQPRPVACAGSQLLDLNGLLDHLVGGVGMFAF